MVKLKTDDPIDVMLKHGLNVSLPKKGILEMMVMAYIRRAAFMYERLKRKHNG